MNKCFEKCQSCVSKVCFKRLIWKVRKMKGRLLLLAIGAGDGTSKDGHFGSSFVQLSSENVLTLFHQCQKNKVVDPLQ